VGEHKQAWPGSLAWPGFYWTTEACEKNIWDIYLRVYVCVCVCVCVYVHARCAHVCM